MPDNQPVEQSKTVAPSDEEFGSFRQGFIAHNEELGNRYDKIAKEMQDAIENKFPADLEKIEDDLKTRYDGLRSKISSLRKLGKDMLIPSLAMRPFQAKMTLAHVSREKTDYDVVKSLLDDVEKEIQEAEAFQEPNVKKEVEALVGSSEKISPVK